MGDWLADLEQFSAPVVAEACQMWRRGQTKRPTIADIRALCIEERDRKAWRPQHQLAGPDTSQAISDDKADAQRRYREAEESREKWAREHGCENFGQAIYIGLEVVERRRVA